MNKDRKLNNPQFCHTATGFLIHDDKVLLIKHKKLKSWLSPGGHIEEGELPHQAAEREFWEETGVRVKVVGYQSEDFMPVPFKSGLHWVCKENYQRRKEGKQPLDKWKKGCEQHFDLAYLVKPVSGLEYKKNVEETDGIAWFLLEELDQIKIFDDVKKTVKMVMKIVQNNS